MAALLTSVTRDLNTTFRIKAPDGVDVGPVTPGPDIRFALIDELKARRPSRINNGQ